MPCPPCSQGHAWSMQHALTVSPFYSIPRTKTMHSLMYIVVAGHRHCIYACCCSSQGSQYHLQDQITLSHHHLPHCHNRLMEWYLWQSCSRNYIQCRQLCYRSPSPGKCLPSKHTNQSMFSSVILPLRYTSILLGNGQREWTVRDCPCTNSFNCLPFTCSDLILNFMMKLPIQLLIKRKWRPCWENTSVAYYIML